MKKTQNILITFGEKVQLERKKRKWTQETLAEKANLHRTYIGMIERAEKNVSLKNIAKIAEALSLSLHELFKEEKWK